jgi:hypothetical protein
MDILANMSLVPARKGIPDCPAFSIVTILTTVSLVLRGASLFVLFTDVRVIKVKNKCVGHVA